ncbi:hypothetical protein GWK47_032355 [Chionoecetes opilio]|uniref:Uncharacterized protein n=1 Tax=Chionoecetes opilio TaxID=41210 RepID=A0A8J4YQC6_CHIOP|nr:hypothetical protein GWK47_032355 [Chionoecetes opilio]
MNITRIFLPPRRQVTRTRHVSYLSRMPIQLIYLPASSPAPRPLTPSSTPPHPSPQLLTPAPNTPRTSPQPRTPCITPDPTPASPQPHVPPHPSPTPGLTQPPPASLPAHAVPSPRAARPLTPGATPGLTHPTTASPQPQMPASPQPHACRPQPYACRTPFPRLPHPTTRPSNVMACERRSTDVVWLNWKSHICHSGESSFVESEVSRCFFVPLTRIRRVPFAAAQLLTTEMSCSVANLLYISGRRMVSVGEEEDLSTVRIVRRLGEIKSRKQRRRNEENALFRRQPRRRCSTCASKAMKRRSQERSVLGAQREDLRAARCLAWKRS